MPTIRLEQATKFYKWEKKRYPAVSDINLKIEQGEFVFVVGSSGAGKSTLLRLMTGELRADRGSVHLDQLNLARVPPWYLPKVRLTFGQVHQEPKLMRKRTIRENLSIVMKVGLTARKEEQSLKMKKALGIVGMSGVEDKYPGELSIGECRRVDLARALINNPPILILDELTANLDEDTNWDLLHLLMEINRQGTTVIMATHASTIVNIMRRRVITLVDGKIAGDVKRGKYGDLSGDKKFQ
jgi:cell division transport system ATP-binding protein